MKKHKHADAMALYAQDAQETDRPWARWEYAYDRARKEWRPCFKTPSWDETGVYRHKEPQKVKRWFWLNTENNYVHNRYLSEEEAERYRDRNAGVILRKLPWSEMEFEE